MPQVPLEESCNTHNSSLQAHAMPLHASKGPCSLPQHHALAASPLAPSRWATSSLLSVHPRVFVHQQHWISMPLGRTTRRRQDRPMQAVRSAPAIQHTRSITSGVCSGQGCAQHGPALCLPHCVNTCIFSCNAQSTRMPVRLSPLAPRLLHRLEIAGAALLQRLCRHLPAGRRSHASRW